MKKTLLILVLTLALALPCLAAAQHETGDINEEIVLLNEAAFVSSLLQISVKIDEYEGKTLMMSGYVYINENNPDAPFSVYRDYACCENDYTPYGFDCVWDGEIPEADSWVTVVGTIGRYKRDNGYTYLNLTLTSLEETPEGERVVLR